MTSPTTRRVLTPRPGLPVTVREAGQGNPRTVLLLHGGAGPDSVIPIIEHLATDHHVVAPTHPGWDATARPDHLHSVADLAAVYLDLLDHLALDQVTVLGTSFGGWIAAEMSAADRAHRITRLVLVDAIGPEIPGHPATVPRADHTGHRAAGTTIPGAPSAGRGPSPAALAALHAYAGPAMSDPTLLHRLADIGAPALVLWGENDPVVHADYGRAYAAAIAGARFHLVPGAGHLPHREAPEATFVALDAFLGATTA